MSRIMSPILWIDDLSMPIEELDISCKVNEPTIVRARFFVTIPTERMQRDIELGFGGRAFMGLMIMPLPKGHKASTLLVEGCDVASSFIYRSKLVVLVESLRVGAEVSVTTKHRLQVKPERPSSAKLRSSQAQKLRSFAHGFMIKHHRLPCRSEIAATLKMSVRETEELLLFTRAPSGSEEVRQGALPRMLLPLSPSSKLSHGVHWSHWVDREEPKPNTPHSQPLASEEDRRREGILASMSPIERDLAQAFIVAPEGIRPIEAHALRKLRRKTSAKKLKSFVEE